MTACGNDGLRMMCELIITNTYVHMHFTIMYENYNSKVYYLQSLINQQLQKLTKTKQKTQNTKKKLCTVVSKLIGTKTFYRT